MKTRSEVPESRLSGVVRSIQYPTIVLDLLILAMLCLLSSPLKAQSFYGAIFGTVADSSGGVIPNATVTATNIGTNEKHSVKTSATGDYRFVDLVPATYSVEVVAANFKRFLQDAVPVQVDSTIRVDAALQVGTATETVEVDTAPPMLQTDSGSVGAEVEAKVVEEMPLNGRNAMNLVSLVPGVIAQGSTTGAPGGNGGNSHTSITGFGNYAIAGGIGNESGNYIDGAPVNMLGSNSVGLILTQDVVQEFKVSMNAVSAEFGRFGGGVIEMTSKSGTNSFHGTAYEYVRNTLLNALPFYTKFSLAPGAKPVAPPYNQNQYGGTIGGPIWKNKIFGFFGIEQYTQHVVASGNGIVPTAIMRGQSTDYPNMAVFKYTGAALPAGVTSAIVDQSSKACPIVNNPMGPGTNTYGVPSSCWDASAQIMKQFYPLPNAPGVTQDSFTATGTNNWIAATHVGNNTLNYTARGDANLGTRQHIFGRYSYWHIGDIPTDNFASATGLPFNHQYGQTRFFNHGITVGDTYTVNPNTVADLRLSWDRMTQLNYPDPEQNKTNEAAFGPAYAAIASTETYHNQPTVTFSGGPGLELTVPWQANQTDVYENYTLNAALTKIMGKHTVKVGGESTMRDHSGIGNFAYYGGYFTFSTNETSATNPATGGLVSGTGDEYASFMIGDYDSMIWQTQIKSFTIDWSHALFVDDTWRVTQNLTLNLGARWEYPGGLYEKKDRAAVFIPNGIDPNAGGANTNGLNPQKLPGDLSLVNTGASPGRGMSTARRDLIGPRVSFAERLSHNQVVRGGFGISYLPPDMPVGLVAFNSPVDGYQTTVNVKYAGGGQAAPGYFLANPLPAAAPAGYLNSFPNGLPQPPGRTDPYPTHLYLGNALAVPVVDKRYPYMQQWNLAYSKEWAGSLVTDVAYMGSKGTHLPDAGVTVSGQNGISGIGIDELNPQYFSMGYAALTANTTTCPNYNGTNTLTGKALNIPMYQCLEQYPQFSNVINVGSNGGSSHYNAVYVNVSKRFRSGGIINGNYTRSKAIDDTDQPGNGEAFQDFYNRAAEKSLSSFDVPNRMVVSYVLNLPFGKGQKWLNSGGLTNSIVGGWQVNSIVQMQSGSASGFTFNNSSFLFSQGKGNAGTSRPDLLPGCNLKGSGGSAFHKLQTQSSGTSWFNASCVVPPGVTSPTTASVNGAGQMIMTYGAPTYNQLEFGDAPRALSTVRGPISQNWDMALSKSTPIWENLNLNLRAEVFDLWNHPPIGNGGTQLTTSGNSFDYVNGNNIANAGTGGMRLIQLSGRITF